MKRKILTTVSMLLVLLFAFGGYSKAMLSHDTMPTDDLRAVSVRRNSSNRIFGNAAASAAYSKAPIAKEEAPSSACFITDKMVLIVPDGKDPSILIRNIIADRVDDYVSPESLTAFEAGIEYTDPRDIMVNAITDITGSYYRSHMSADFKYPDWYGGSYIMRKQEYDVDAPYETDGTNEPFKYCLQIVRGMESQIEDLKELLKPYEDYVIYKTVEFSFEQCQELGITLRYSFDRIGIEPIYCNVNSKFNIVDCAVYIDCFDETAFACAKRFANFYGQAVIIEKIERYTFY